MPTVPCEFIDAWQCTTAGDAEEVIAFWSREHANVSGERAAQRVKELVVRVMADNGELVAISTAEPRIIPRLGQPMYYYRCFVGAAWRDGSLVRPLLRRSFDVLDRWAREHEFPCIGVLLELENPGFTQTLQQAYWTGSQFSFIGRSRRGLDLRIRYFRGAQLKARS